MKGGMQRCLYRNLPCPYVVNGYDPFLVFRPRGCHFAQFRVSFEASFDSRFTLSSFQNQRTPLATAASFCRMFGEP